MATRTVKPGQGLQSAINSCGSGDTLIMEDGIWYERIRITNSNITIKARNRRKAIIDGSRHAAGAGNYSILVEVKGANVTLDGLVIRNFKHNSSKYLRGLLINGDGGGGRKFTGRNLLVHDTNADNVNLWQCRDALVENSTLHTGSWENTGSWKRGDWPNSGIALKGGGGHVLRNITAYGGFGEICNADKGCNGALIENCVFHSYWAAPYVNESTNITWRGNFIYARGKEGFSLRNELIHNYPECRNITFEDNIVVGSTPGLAIDLRAWKKGSSTMHNIVIRRNTFVTGSGVRIEGNRFPGGVIEDNIFHVTGSTGAQGGGFTWRRNAWNKNPGGAAAGNGGRVGDLKLRNPGASIASGQGDPNNYAPQSGSIAESMGGNMGAGYFGGNRNKTVGAIELNGRGKMRGDGGPVGSGPGKPTEPAKPSKPTQPDKPVTEDGKEKIANGSFTDEGGKWGWRSDDDAVILYTAKKATITLLKKSENTQLYQAGFALKKGVEYSLRFDVGELDKGEKFTARVRMDDAPYTNLGLNETADLGQNVFTFKAKADCANARLQFVFGQPIGIWIDNVSLRRASDSVAPPKPTEPGPDIGKVAKLLRDALKILEA